MKLEAAFQRKFGRWLQHAYSGSSAAFELKRTRTRSLPLKSIREHQTASLLQARTGLYYKPPDDSRAYKPCDTLFLRDADGFLVVAYGPILKGFYMVDIDHVEELRSTGAVSINEDDCQRLGTYYEFKKLPN